MTYRVYGIGLMTVLMCILMLLPVELFAQHGRGRMLPGAGMNRWIWAGPLPVVNLKGVVFVDSAGQGPGRFSSFSRVTYFLDTALTDQATERNAQLFFGPPGYQPAGATLPKAMDTVTVRGGLDTSFTPPVVAVYQINGTQWRDSTGAPEWGRWIHRNDADSVRITNGIDTFATLLIPPGVFGSGQMGGGMMWPDSILSFITEFSPESLFTPTTGRIVTGVYITFLGPDGTPLMQRGIGGMMGGDSSGFGTITFKKPISLRFHLQIDTTLGFSRNFRMYTVSHLAADSTWKPVTNVAVDSAGSNITVTDSLLASYYVITAPVAVSVEPMDYALPEAFALQQNYPNPFNPVTNIVYTVGGPSMVRLTVYDILGREVKVLVNEPQKPGSYRVQFNGAGLSSGVYFYRLVTPAFTQTKSLMLLK